LISVGELASFAVVLMAVVAVSFFVPPPVTAVVVGIGVSLWSFIVLKLRGSR